MGEREVRRFVDRLLRGRRSAPFRPDEFEAAQMRAAIELRGARAGSGAPSEEFLADLHRRLATEMQHEEPSRPVRTGRSATRREVIGGVSVAAAAVTVGVVVDHTLISGPATETPAAEQEPQTLAPATGEWRPVAASSDLSDGSTRPFDVGSVAGFVHRVDGKVHAVSGACTHQGCRLWFDAPADRLRCPCHSTSFTVTGDLLTHQLPIAPPPLPRIQVRETGGTVEIYAPIEPA